MITAFALCLGYPSFLCKYKRKYLRERSSPPCLGTEEGSSYLRNVLPVLSLKNHNTEPTKLLPILGTHYNHFRVPTIIALLLLLFLLNKHKLCILAEPIFQEGENKKDPTSMPPQHPQRSKGTMWMTLPRTSKPVNLLQT